MEVFVQGVSDRSTEKQLREFFLPLLNQLSVEHWHCEKRPGKPFANLTFLSREDGENFLCRYGLPELGSRPAHSRHGRASLSFRGYQLSCRQSNQAPDRFMLRSLQREANDPERKKKVHHKHSGESSILNTAAISCGLWQYVDSRPVFTPCVRWEARGTIKFGSSRMIIRMATGERIGIEYWTVHTIAVEGLPQSAITLTLKMTPRLFRSKGTDSTRVTVPPGLFGALKAMENLQVQEQPARIRVPGLNAEHEEIAGVCLVYRISLRNVTLEEQLKALSRVPGLPPVIRRHIEIGSRSRPLKEDLKALLQAFERDVTFPFPLKFQLQKLLQDGLLPPNLVGSLMRETRGLVSRFGTPACVSAMRSLILHLPYAGLDVDARDFQLENLIALLRDYATRFHDETWNQDHEARSEQRALIHRVTVTPTGVYLSGPDWESKNRVLRKYPEHHDHFIRVQFSDEDGTALFFSYGVSNEVIFHTRFKKILNDGISIGGQRFSFLGFSHSSLRAQSCWFMSPFAYQGSLLFHGMLIRDLGDFSHIRSPARCAARIGQAFSETPIAITIASGVAGEMNDVERNGHVFSDGVGTASLSVIRQIWNRLPVSDRIKPTVFQIRYKGAKGMIALDSRLQGDSIRLRPSMIKFSGSTSTDLEICDAAYKPLPFFLNQQSIKILEDMGVEHSFFLSHQAKAVRQLQSVVSSSRRASDFVQAQFIGVPIHFPWFIRELDSHGLAFDQDRFLRDVIEIAILVELRALKYKARIPVALGYTLFGILDETGILEEGQIFCIVEAEGKAKIITGKDVIITRSPPLHPGDIQIAAAVNVPEDSPLMRLRNCICFSQKGSRDLPSMLSGGDLDGDLFQILFDPQARPTEVYAPASYARPAPVGLNRPVTREDMTDFFVKFMETDQLGRIANLHKALADQHDDGVLNGDCLRLAEMHSTAVDFSKTGIPVDIRQLPRHSRCRPDFMAPGSHCVVEKDKRLCFDAERENHDDDDSDGDPPKHRYYESTKILGKLYRAIDEKAIFSDLQKPETRRYGPEGQSTRSVLSAIWKYVRNRCQLFKWHHHLERARGIREEYEDCILNIAADYSDHPPWSLSEREVFIGNILNKTGSQSKRQRELSVTMKQCFNDDLTYIVNCIVMDGHESLERSIACLQVGMEKGQRRLKNGTVLVSFGYVAAAVCLREMEPEK